MAFDGVFLHQLVGQLQPLVGGRISKIYQISDTEILIVIKSHKVVQLMISAHSSYNRIHITANQYPTRSTPSNFIMLLRKYLEGGFIISIKQVDLDRYLIIEVSSRNELGDKIILHLYVELMGKYANVILVKDERIIDALKHIPPFQNTIRTIQPGAVFKPTPPQAGKINPFCVNELDSYENLFEKLEGFSPLLSTEVLYRIDHGQSYQSIMEEIKQSDKLYLTTNKNEEFFHCIPLTHLGNQYQQYEICQGLDVVYFNKEERERIRHIAGDLFKFTRKEIHKYTVKIDRLNASLQEALDCDKYRVYGETIYAHLDEIQKGMKSITLKDWDEQEVTIPLDEKLDGKGNAKKHFTKYRKLTTGQKYIQEQLEIANEMLEYFTQISQQLEIADYQTALEIKTELQQNGYLKVKNEKGRSKKPKQPRCLKITFNDKQVLVGRNNIQNNFVTFEASGRYDSWFHVKDGTGAHVCINTDNPSEEEIRFCAMLAAYYSKSRYSSSVPVNYTLVKNLKKIPNSKLGKVIMKEYKTIYIDPDENYLSQYIDLL